jgi:nucleotide-binding universal stress UspA family protein
MKKILVPVDGSPASREAAKKSIEIAKQYDGSVVFLSIAEVRGKYTFMGDGVVSFPVNHSQISDVLVETQTKMLDVFMNIIDCAGVKIEKLVMPGVPYEEILRFTNENNVDLIVMGRRGFTKIKRFFLGSVTQRVISDAPCPVLVINEKDEKL